MWILKAYCYFFLKNVCNYLQQKFQELKTLLQDYAVDSQAISLGEKLVQILSNQKKKIVFAESCTGGFLSSLITEVAGASQVFQAGYVVYQKEEKNILPWGFQKNIL